MEAPAAALVNDAQDNFDAERIWACMMTNEKPGGHGERSVAVGVLDMAMWDAVAKIEGKLLYRLLADRFNGGQCDEKVFVYAAGGYYYPGKNVEALRNEMRKYLDLGYSVVKMKIGGESLDDDLHRIDAVIKVVGSAAPAVVGRPTARPSSPLQSTVGRVREGCFSPTACSGTRKPATRWISTFRQALPRTTHYPMATGENLFSMQDARNLLCVTAACERTGTGSSSTARCRMGWSNTCARFAC